MSSCRSNNTALIVGNFGIIVDKRILECNDSAEPRFLCFLWVFKKYLGHRVEKEGSISAYSGLLEHRFRLHPAGKSGLIRSFREVT